MYGRLHADICNVSQLLTNVVKIQIKLTKARPEFYLLGSKENGKVYFKILEALLYFKRIRPNPCVIAAHNETTRCLSYQIQTCKNRSQDF